MKHTLYNTLASLALAAIFGLALPVQAQDSNRAAMPTAINTALEQKEAMRDLWIEHIFWIRIVVIETLTGNPAAAKVGEGEVIANAKRVAAVIGPFNGKAASDKFFGLIVGHYEPIKKYLDATIAGSPARQDLPWKELVANGDALASFLSEADGLPLDAARAMLLVHVSHHRQQIKQLHDHQYEAEAQTWTAMRQHMYAIADGLSSAIVNQFPAKFSSSPLPRQ
jgi:hypothetical protein